ncbi:hypothetical protein GGI35DRAFT_199060 [Trichoderma velutinum]
MALLLIGLILIASVVSKISTTSRFIILYVCTPTSTPLTTDSERKLASSIHAVSNNDKVGSGGLCTYSRSRYIGRNYINRTQDKGEKEANANLTTICLGNSW